LLPKYKIIIKEKLAELLKKLESSE